MIIPWIDVAIAELAMIQAERERKKQHDKARDDLDKAWAQYELEKMKKEGRKVN